MLAAAPIRPAKHSVLHTFQAYLDAPPDLVFEAVVARLSHPDVAVTGFYADPASRLVVTEGSWWYRAEYRILIDHEGSHLDHVVLNVAQYGERAAMVAGRRAVMRAPLAFHDLVKSLRTALETGPAEGVPGRPQ